MTAPRVVRAAGLMPGDVLVDLIPRREVDPTIVEVTRSIGWQGGTSIEVLLDTGDRLFMRSTEHPRTVIREATA